MLVTRKGVLTAAVAACAVAAHGAATVSVDTSTNYQTIMGYGASAWTPHFITPGLRSDIAKEAVNELGLNRLRMEGLPSGNRSNTKRWEWLNDDGDPEHINWSAFNTADFDVNLTKFVVPFKQQVEARGEFFDSYVSPSFFNGGSSGAVPVWLLRSPGEYAEFAMSILLHLRSIHGIEATYYSILNEAGNGNPFSAPVVAEMAKALAPRMEAAGFSTKIEFPECASVHVSWNYVDAAKNDDEMWSHVGLVAYHLYHGSALDTAGRSQIRDFAWGKGLPTGQTEFMGLTTTHLHLDLTAGGVSYWEIYGIGSQFDWNGANYNTVVRKGWYWPFRQLMYYVRPGAVRVEVTSSDSQLRPLTFVKDGKTIVVLINDLDSTARTVDLSGLTPGGYGVSQSVDKAKYQELGLRTVGAGGTLAVDVPGKAVLTVYPHPGQNLPPTVTDYRASPTYLTMPASSTTLSADAQDPELDPIAYSWTVTKEPGAASVVLVTPDVAGCQATGLTVAGDYAFEVAVSDPTHAVTREVRITVHQSNQPPLPDDVHNRIPVLLTLPQTSAKLRSWAWDLEGDNLAFRWSVASQPAGANAQLATPDSDATDITGMTVAGDYVFKLEVSDPTHTVSDILTVPVYPVNNAPVISSAVAVPADLTLPTSSTSLSAVTSDPDSDVISHWWSVKSAPAGAKPVFASQGAKDTTVGGLIVDGTYVFTLTVVDRAGYVTRDVTVNVAPGSNPPLISVVTPNGGETYVGGQDVTIGWTSSNFAGNVKIELFDGASWAIVAASTADDGSEPWKVPNVGATGCKLRVSDAIDGDPSDESDETFTIVAAADGGGDGGRSGLSCAVSGTGSPLLLVPGILAFLAWYGRARHKRSLYTEVTKGG